MSSRYFQKITSLGMLLLLLATVGGGPYCCGAGVCRHTRDVIWTKLGISPISNTANEIRVGFMAFGWSVGVSTLVDGAA